MGLDPGFVLFNQIWDDGNTMGIYNQHYCGLGFNRVLSASADNQNIASNRQSDVHITVNIITGYPVSVARLLQPQVSKGVWHSYTSRFVHGGLFHPCQWPVGPLSAANATAIWLKPELAEGAPK